MTGAEYKAIREWLGYTQTQLAQALQVHPRTIHRRERDHLRINREAECALLSLAVPEDTLRKATTERRDCPVPGCTRARAYKGKDWLGQRQYRPTCDKHRRRNDGTRNPENNPALPERRDL